MPVYKNERRTIMYLNLKVNRYVIVCICLFINCLGTVNAKVVPGTTRHKQPEKTPINKNYDNKLIETKTKVNLTLGTASESGVFYPVGRGISKMINQRKLEYGLRFITYSTSGSKYNLQAIRNGELDLAISRFDLAYEAYRGIGSFEKQEPYKDLRYIATLYPMPIGIVVHKKSNIQELKDIKGKRVNIGNPGSGKRSVANMIFKAMKWERSDFDRVTGLATREMGNIFCYDGIDAIIELLGMPAEFYNKITHECLGRFISVPRDVTFQIQRENPFVEYGTIAAGLYPHNPEPVSTFQIGAVLLSSRQLSGDVISRVCETIFGNIDEFRKVHPALKNFSLNNIKKQKSFIPYHNGAIKFYRQQGLSM